MENWSIWRTYDVEFMRGDRLIYYAMLVEDVPREGLEQFGTMTQEEAEAMAKLLNASQP